MKRRKVVKPEMEHYEFSAEGLDFMVAEQMLLMHLLQNLDIARKENLALVFTDIEHRVLEHAVSARLATLVPEAP